MSREDHIGDFGTAGRASVANLHHDLRVIVVGEGATRPSNDRPSFTNNLGTRRDLDSIGNNVDTSVEENDLAASELWNDK